MTDDYYITPDMLMDAVRNSPNNWMSEEEIENLRPQLEQKARQLADMIRANPALQKAVTTTDVIRGEVSIAEAT